MTTTPIIPSTSGKFQKVVTVLQQNDGTDIDIQNPLPTDGDSVYAKDIDVTRSVTTGWTGDLLDLFGDLTEGLTYTGTDNPKNLIVYFKRSILSNAMGLSATTGNFSNVKVIALFPGGVELELFDGSASSTNLTTKSILHTSVAYDGIRLEFHTADNVTLTNFHIFKTISTVARIQAQKPDGVVTNINATTGGNLKTALEEFDDSFETLPLPSKISVGDAKRNITYEDTSFVTGDSPVVHDVETGLGRTAIDGYIVNDGGGDILVEVSNDGTNYGSASTMKDSDVYDLQGVTISKIRLTWVADTGYRVNLI